MSSWSGGEKKRKGSGKGWRGSKSGPSKPAYGWQQRSDSRALRAGDRGRRWQSQWVLYTLLGASLLCLFLYVVLIRPSKTPMLMAVGVGYTAPVPPNQWVVEDRDALQDLKTLSIVEINDSWTGGMDSDAWKVFRERLADHQALRRGFRTVREPLIIYFSMPGVVNEEGIPCLLPPGASPLASDDWLTIESLVRQIDETVPTERHKLLILDSNQVLVNWRMGIVYNTFAERLKGYIQRCGVKNLVVLTAADEGQVSWASPQLGGTSFGQFLRLGLAGAADRDSASPDRKVSLQELVEYLQKKVNGWAWDNRAAVQRPEKWSGDARPDLDFFVAHALRDRALAGYRDALAGGERFKSSISIENIEEVWARLDQLRELDVLRYDPISLSIYENRLLRLEQLAYGGRAYTSAAKQEFDDLNSRLKVHLDEAIKMAVSNSSALADHWAVTKPDEAKPVRLTQGLHSLPLREYFGQADKSTSQRIQTLWQQLAASVGGFEPSTDSDSAVIRSALALTETQLLVAAHQQRIWDIGENARHLREVLELRGRGERLAVPHDERGFPGDERAHYYVRPALNVADKALRLAEDELFVEASTFFADKRWDVQASRGYNAADDIRAKISEALSICDRAWAETPHLAKWLCSPGRAPRSPDPPDNREVEQLVGFIGDTRILGEAIGRLRGTREGLDECIKSVERFLADADGVRQRLQAYLDQFNNARRDLGAARSQKEMLAFESVLALPLIDAESRKELLENRDDLAVELHKRHLDSGGPEVSATAAAHESAGSQVESGDPKPTTTWNLADVMKQWNQSPLLAILDVHDSGRTNLSVTERVGDVNRLEMDCRAARARLSNPGGGHRQNQAEALEDQVLADRLELSRAELRIRAMAPIQPAFHGSDPVAQLRRFDLQQLMLWHARRVLDGFWHTVTGPDPKSIADMLSRPVASTQPLPPFFDAAADDYLQIAERIYDPLPRGVRLQTEELRRLIDRRRAASQYGLQLQPTSGPILDSPSDVAVEVEISPHPNGPDVPSGRAAVFIQNQNGRLEGVLPNGGPWGRASVPIEDRQIERLFARARVGNSPDLEAVAFFRGRQYRQTFAVNSLGGALIQYEPPQYDRQSVTLLGDQPKPPSVVFILDCSGSMQTQIEAEIPGTFKSRMEAARTALGTMLEELSKRRGASRPRIGAYFFGHRVAWKAGIIPPIIDPKPGATPDRIPQNLPPALDVERVLPLGDFYPQVYGEVSERLQRVEPHGLTPVNLAIVQALGEFDEDDARFSKSIIVITDGRNDQRHPSSTAFGAVNPTTASGVIRAWNLLNAPIPVFIVGFGIPKGERGAAEREFKQIADHTGGEWLPTESGGELIEHLRKRLDVHGYAVRELRGDRRRPVTRDASSGEESPVELNTLVPVLTREYPPPVDLELEFQSVAKQVTLEGGEALRLRVTRDGDITFEEYHDDKTMPVQLVLGSSGTTTDLFLWVHHPTREGSEVEFRLAVQDQLTHFTRRPKEVWVEVTPEGTNEKYIYYDAMYEPDTPVPVVSFTASNWPPGVDHARVKYWCSDQASKPVKSIRLLEVRGQDLPSAPFQPIPSVPEVGVRVGLQSAAGGEFRVEVDEKYDGSAASLGAIRVWLDVEDGSLRPQSISHRFDVGNNVARHQFLFRSRLAEREFAENVTVRIASSASIKQNAHHLDDPNGLRVPIVNKDATHIPSAAEAVP